MFDEKSVAYSIFNLNQLETSFVAVPSIRRRN